VTIAIIAALGMHRPGVLAAYRAGVHGDARLNPGHPALAGAALNHACRRLQQHDSRIVDAISLMIWYALQTLRTPTTC
jgi:hypothetical protein